MQGGHFYIVGDTISPWGDVFLPFSPCGYALESLQCKGYEGLVLRVSFFSAGAKQRDAAWSVFDTHVN